MIRYFCVVKYQVICIKILQTDVAMNLILQSSYSQSKRFLNLGDWLFTNSNSSYSLTRSCGISVLSKVRILRWNIRGSLKRKFMKNAFLVTLNNC